MRRGALIECDADMPVVAPDRMALAREMVDLDQQRERLGQADRIGDDHAAEEFPQREAARDRYQPGETMPAHKRTETRRRSRHARTANPTAKPM